MKDKGSNTEDTGRKRRPTRIPISSRTGKLLVLAGVVALVLIAWFVPSALYIAVGGFALSLILSFPVRALSHFVPRWLAILITYCVLIGLVVFALLFLLPLLVEQLSSLISAAPDIARSADRLARDLLRPLAARNLLQGASPEQVISELPSTGFQTAPRMWPKTFLNGLVGILSSTVSFGVNLIGALFVSVYLLLDVRRIKAAYLQGATRTATAGTAGSFGTQKAPRSRKYLARPRLRRRASGYAHGTVALFLLGVP